MLVCLVEANCEQPPLLNPMGVSDGALFLNSLLCLLGLLFVLWATHSSLAFLHLCALGWPGPFDLDSSHALHLMVELLYVGLSVALCHRFLDVLMR